VEYGEAYVGVRRFERPLGEGSAGGHALGIKTEFLVRSPASVLVLASHPIPIEPRCALLSLSVLGRGLPHRLSIIALDYYGRPYELPLGSLAFSGWKRLIAYVPRLDPSTGSGIAQDDSHYGRDAGLRVAGFKIDFDADEAYGTFYTYLADLEATVESSRAKEGDEEAKPSGEPDREAHLAPTAQAAAPLGKTEPTGARIEAVEAAGIKVVAVLRERIAAGLEYPDAARRRGLEGRLIVSFVVGEGGELVSSTLARSSGSDILDRAGLELLRKAFPVENDAQARLELSIEIGYALTSAGAEGGPR
jgi:TonB family protein